MRVSSFKQNSNFHLKTFLLKIELIRKTQCIQHQRSSSEAILMKYKNKIGHSPEITYPSKNLYKIKTEGKEFKSENIYLYPNTQDSQRNLTKEGPMKTSNISMGDKYSVNDSIYTFRKRNSKPVSRKQIFSPTIPSQK